MKPAGRFGSFIKGATYNRNRHLYDVSDCFYLRQQAAYMAVAGVVAVAFVRVAY